jgi:hypothetical protein
MYAIPRSSGARSIFEPCDRVIERRRAGAVAKHFGETEGLSIAQIADRLGCSPGTVKPYFYYPMGERTRAVKARYLGVCRGCCAYTQPRNGKGDAHAYCKGCHPGRSRPGGPANGYSLPCTSGGSATVGCRRPTTDRARMVAGAGEMRLIASARATGPRRVS